MAMEPLSPEELVRQVMLVRARLAPRLPGIDPGDLVLILQSLLRPPGCGRRFFLRRMGARAYVP